MYFPDLPPLFNPYVCIISERTTQQKFDNSPPQLTMGILKRPITCIKVEELIFDTHQTKKTYINALNCFQQKQYHQGLMCAQKGLNHLHSMVKQPHDLYYKTYCCFSQLRILYCYLLDQVETVVDKTSILLAPDPPKKIRIWCLLLRAHCFLRSKNPEPEAALNSIQLAFKLKPKGSLKVELFICQGFAFSKLKKTLSVREAFKKAKILSPKHPHLVKLEKLF